VVLFSLEITSGFDCAELQRLPQYLCIA